MGCAHNPKETIEAKMMNLKISRIRIRVQKEEAIKEYEKVTGDYLKRYPIPDYIDLFNNEKKKAYKKHKKPGKNRKKSSCFSNYTAPMMKKQGTTANTYRSISSNGKNAPHHQQYKPLSPSKKNNREKGDMKRYYSPKRTGTRTKRSNRYESQNNYRQNNQLHLRKINNYHYDSSDSDGDYDSYDEGDGGDYSYSNDDMNNRNTRRSNIDLRDKRTSRYDYNNQYKDSTSSYYGDDGYYNNNNNNYRRYNDNDYDDRQRQDVYRRGTNRYND